MRIETPLSEIACSLAGSGAGVTLCDPFTATEYATRGIVVRPFEPRIHFEFAALYAAQGTPPPVGARIHRQLPRPHHGFPAPADPALTELDAVLAGNGRDLRRHERLARLPRRPIEMTEHLGRLQAGGGDDEQTYRAVRIVAKTRAGRRA